MITPWLESSPGAVKTLLLAGRTHHCWDLWTFTLTCGIILRWTSADIDLTVGGNTYKSEVAISREKCKYTTGLETSTLDVTVSPNDTDNEYLVAGIPLRQAIRGGLFDGANVRLDWAYYELDMEFVGAILRFTGSVGDIDAYGIKAKLTVNSPLKKLDQEIPTGLYGAGCRFVLGDVRCGVNLESFAVSGLAVSDSANGVVKTDISAETKSYDGGVLVHTSSDGAVFRRAIRTNTLGTFSLRTPLPWAPETGDTIKVYPGCDHSKPSFASASQTSTIPSGLTILAANATTFNADKGVMLIGLTTTIPGYWNDDTWVEAVTTKAPDIVMTKVSGTPSGGQYAISGNVYTFATENIGREVIISYETATGGLKGCRRFWGSAARLRFGGMPFIPSPETAY